MEHAFHYHFHKNPSLKYIPSQLNPVHKPEPFFLKINSNIILS
jgi:hypothetical protein